MASITLAAIVFRLGLTTAMFRFSFDNPGRHARRGRCRRPSPRCCSLSTVGLRWGLGLLFLDPLATCWAAVS